MCGRGASAAVSAGSVCGVGRVPAPAANYFPVLLAVLWIRDIFGVDPYLRIHLCYFEKQNSKKNHKIVRINVFLTIFA
jgi:hypothetical protein